MPWLKMGSTGEDVTKLQKALTDKGYDTSGIDGSYGKFTADAVKRYQTDNGLTIDSEAGPETMGSLYSSPTNPISTLSTSNLADIPTPTNVTVPTNATTGLTGSGIGAGMVATAGVTGATGLVGTGVGAGTGSGYNNLTNVFKTPETPKIVTDPYADKMNAALDKILGFDNSTPYDVTTDPLYAPMKQQYEQAGQTAFNNQIGSLSTMTGGRPSTAAVGTATGAQNKYAQDFSGVVLPQLVDAAYKKGQDKFNNLASQLEALQGMDNTYYNRGRDTVNDTGMVNGEYTQSGKINNQNIESNTTKSLADKASLAAAANYDDIQGYIDTLEPNDPLIPYLQAERQNKIQAQNVAKTASEKLEYDRLTAAEKQAYDRATASEKFALDKRYTNAQIDNLYADNARQASGGSGGSGGSSSSSGGSSSAGSSGSIGLENLPVAYQTAIDSGNPKQWLLDNAPYMDTKLFQALDTALGSNPGMATDKILSNLTPEQRDYYNGMRDIFVNGSRDGMYGAAFKDNPEAALRQLTSSSANRNLLGPAYDLLVRELEKMVSDKIAREKADPYGILEELKI